MHFKNNTIRHFTRIFQSKYSNINKPISEIEQSEKRKYKTVFLVCSYLGQKYRGITIQISEGSISYPTVQSELLTALHKVGALDLHLQDMSKTNFSVASRTDKGVSALIQVAALKMDVSRDYLESLNAELPNDIRVWEIKRTTRYFKPRRICSMREYFYLCPSYTFSPENTDYANFRIQHETKRTLQELIAKYKGVHNFYNFTNGYKADDPKLRKRILEASIEDIFISNNTEFILLNVRGESFLYHQIRKMIGLVISVMKGKCPKSIFEKALSTEEVRLPIAPGLGLVLANQTFPEYNNMLTKLRLQDKHPALHIDPNHPKIQQFKNEVVFRHIIDSEVNGLCMKEWIDGYLNNHDFE